MLMALKLTETCIRFGRPGIVLATVEVGGDEAVESFAGNRVLEDRWASIHVPHTRQHVNE